MQANEFEKKIQNKMEGFELVPGEEVWKKVSARIEKDGKTKKLGFFWFAAAILILTATTGWWFLNNNNNNNNGGDKSLTETIIDSPLLKPDKGETDAGINKKSSGERSSSSLKTSLAARQGTSKQGTKRKQQIMGWNVQEKRSPLEYDRQTINDHQPDVRVNRSTPNKTPRFEKQFKLPAHKFYKPEQAVPKTQPGLVNQDQKEKGEVQEVAKTGAKKKQSNKKWEAGFTIFGGVSNNLAGIPVVSRANYLADNFSTTPAQNSNGGFGSTFNALHYRKSISYGIGIFATRPLSKRLSLAAGIDYHFYSAKTLTGSKVTASRTFYDSSLAKSTSVSEFYSYGQSETFTNKYHYVELPINLQLRLNKNEQKPVLLFGGVSPGYLAGSHALYANSREQKYYIENEQFKRLSLSSQLGLSLPVISSRNYRISAGPVFQFGFTNMPKTETRTNQHLLFTGIKTNISLK